ncbi:MAG: hypothetical protein N2200_02530 [Bacteroidia bacterium]|nr:hypothetical protein [Bacteroidia bacterium]
MRKASWLLLLWSCQSSEHPIPKWYAVEITGETIPLIQTGASASDSIRAVRVTLRRDPLTDKPEWLSGHRHALAFYLEQFPIQVVVIESPWNDTAFFRAGRVWSELFQKWLVEEFLPFIRPYEKVKYVVFGREWHRAPMDTADWRRLLASLERVDTTHQWGFCAGRIDDIPTISLWDFLAIDYQHFYPAHERATYHARWESAGKPLLLLYPNLHEPDKESAKAERHKYWKSPPFAIVYDYARGEGRLGAVAGD